MLDFFFLTGFNSAQNGEKRAKKIKSNESKDPVGGRNKQMMRMAD